MTGESHGQRSLGDYSLIGHTESETTGATEQSVAESKKKKKRGSKVGYREYDMGQDLKVNHRKLPRKLYHFFTIGKWFP